MRYLLRQLTDAELVDKTVSVTVVQLVAETNVETV